jgi:glucoamylase
LRPDPAWIERRRAGAVRALRRAVSATDLVRTREPFGWTVRPARGSILASARTASWDPEPDYFHHWVRDAAVALMAWPEAMASSDERGWWAEAFADHVRFSLALSDPERRGPPANPLRATTRADHLRFLRPDEELAALRGSAWLEEPRFGAGGGPDPERWGRPQDDGPALRASAVMRVTGAVPALASAEAERLVERDLAHLVRVAGRPCIGPWEDGPERRVGFTLIAQWDALDRRAARHAAAGREAEARDLAAAADAVMRLIEATADPGSEAWRESVEAPPERVDAGTVLAILHAGRREGPLAMGAPRTRATVAALERGFAGWPVSTCGAVAMGRWAGDDFAGGNPWYPVTLGCAELHYRIGTAEAVAKAEAWMALLESVAPEGDDLPEQLDRVTGEPRSCLGLTWSAAAFLGAAAARDLVV